MTPLQPCDLSDLDRPALVRLLTEMLADEQCTPALLTRLLARRIAELAADLAAARRHDCGAELAAAHFAADELDMTRRRLDDLADELAGEPATLADARLALEEAHVVVSELAAERARLTAQQAGLSPTAPTWLGDEDESEEALLLGHVARDVAAQLCAASLRATGHVDYDGDYDGDWTVSHHHAWLLEGRESEEIGWWWHRVPAGWDGAIPVTWVRMGAGHGA